jgi:hypothetical protein
LAQTVIQGQCQWTLNECKDLDPNLESVDVARCAAYPTTLQGTTLKCCCFKATNPPIAGGPGALNIPGGHLTNPLNANHIPDVIGNVILKFLTILAGIALLMFVYGGFLWLTAAGNDKNIQAGRDTLTWATIGLFIIFLAYILVGFVLQAIGVV